MQKLIYFLILTAGVFNGGCALISIVSSPTPHEKKIPAEYDLAKLKGKKILVLVSADDILSRTNMRYHLTETITTNLIKKVDVSSRHIIDYDKLVRFETMNSEFLLLEPAETGRGLGADIVLFVEISRYELDEILETNYYNGYLSAEAVLYETTTAEKVWPVSAESKTVKVSFDIEKRGQEIAVRRLASSLAYCITRYFYNCPTNKFKILDESNAINQEGWDTGSY